MRREAMLDRARSGDPWDVLILGGGATGLGIAVDAALRGYRTALFEARDFAQGTSSRSTKLIHGGVRYLAQGRVGLVREALREREILLRNAPHLVHPLAFVIPAYRPLSRFYYGLGLKLYDLLAGRTSLPNSRIVGRAEALRAAPTLRPDRLEGGVIYEDAQFDDARLAIALLATFADLGGVALNGAPAVRIEKVGGVVSGVVVRDEDSGAEWAVRGRVVVNATGVFADGVRRLDDPDAAPLVRPSRGIHLVLPADVLPGPAAVLVPRTDDGRVVFAIPWKGRVLLGTTDTPVDQPEIEPRPSGEEVAFLIEHGRRYLGERVDPSRIAATFAGLRPLIASGGATKGISREHALAVSPSGLVTVVGGKWTTYRRVAADAVDRAADVAGLPRRPCTTAGHRLHGAEGWWAEEGPLSVYGRDADGIRALIREHPELAEPIVPGLAPIAAEVIWAARHEMARTVEDVLARRTRLLVLDAAAARAAASRVAALMARELGRHSV